MRRAVLVTCFIVFGVAACSSEETTATSAPADTSPTTTVIDDTGDSAPTTTLQSDETTTTAAAVVSGPPVLDISEAEPVTLITESGGGDRPVFEWQAVDGASLYVVAVYDADERAYWSGQTNGTSLPLGSVQLPDEASGPRIGDGFTWSVYALDDAGLLLTTSELRAISP
jgi:hypothetical protein